MSEAAQHIENAQSRSHRGVVSHSSRVKPANLIYSVDEVPPLPLTIVLGLQHVFLMSVGWIFVVVVATSIGTSALETQTLIRMSMIASGLATILQAQTRGPIGSGYLCPFSCGPAYVSASILAGQVGGLPLLWGMTTFSGVFEALLSRAMKRLQRVFPPEVTGLVVALVGIELIGIGAPRFLGYDAAVGRLDMRAGAVALITLAAMLAPTLWSKSKLRLYPVLIGLFCWIHSICPDKNYHVCSRKTGLGCPVARFSSFAVSSPFQAWNGVAIRDCECLFDAQERGRPDAM